jgi:hypothetical protein
MTQPEKLIARLESQPADGLYEIRVVIVDGHILFWFPPELIGKMEGLPKSVKIEERKEVTV